MLQRIWFWLMGCGWIQEPKQKVKAAHRVKLNWEKAAYVRHAHNVLQIPQKDLAQELGVSPNTISDVITGKTWGGV